MFSLAHLSDPHMGPLPWPGPRALMGKRILGYLNWLRGRRAIHLRRSLDSLTADVAAQAPDHVAVTGDLVNIGLPAEFEATLAWLHELGAPDRVSVVPGNHDAYVRIAREEGIGRWTQFMESNTKGRAFGQPDESGFPFVRVLGDVALIGLSTAIPTRPFAAYGRLGKPQLEALPAILRTLHKADKFRVILLHHPPLPGLAKRRRGLRDVAQFAEILIACGAELVLYGHDHVQRVTIEETETGPVAAVCVPSASASVAGYKPLARYNIYRIDKTGNGWRCTMTGRGLEAPGAPVSMLEEKRLIG